MTRTVDAKAKKVRSKLADLDREHIPTVEAVREQQQEREREKGQEREQEEVRKRESQREAVGKEGSPAPTHERDAEKARVLEATARETTRAPEPQPAPSLAERIEGYRAASRYDALKREAKTPDRDLTPTPEPAPAPQKAAPPAPEAQASRASKARNDRRRSPPLDRAGQPDNRKKNSAAGNRTEPAPCHTR
jgi:hypothetical protein